jgi:hypothetical protein
MNYINHIRTFYSMAATDERLSANHISLYMALFQFWNLNRFENPFQINRFEVLQMCKIGSLNTYHKCLRDLDCFGYIQYIPSFNPLAGSLVNLYNFDTGVDTADDTTLGAKSVQLPYRSRRKIDTGVDTAPKPLYKHSKHINNKTDREEQAQNANQNSDNRKEEKRKKVAPKKEKETVPRNLSAVIAFFQAENSTEIEAKKFYNHFESNGWKVGGKSPMKDWQAAARNWMLNCANFAPKSKPTSQNPIILNTSKNYGEPL